MTVLGGGEAIARMLQATKRLVDALVGRGAPRVSELHHEFPHEIRHGLRQVTQKDKPIEFDKIGPAAHTGRATTAGHPGTGADAGRPIRGSDPTAEDGFLDLPIEEQIRRLEAVHGIRTDAERTLELSLFMEDKFRDIALISRQVRPETIFDGPEGWASWLDARLFARQNLHREAAECRRRIRPRSVHAVVAVRR